MEAPKAGLVKIRAIIVHEYWADPAHYDTTDPKEMCKIDAENWINAPDRSYEAFFNKEDTVKVIVEAPDNGVNHGPLTLENKWDA